MAELTVLDDALAVIRARPQMYVGDGDRSLEIAQALISDALVLGASHVSCDRRLGWFLVAADLDWLTASCRFPQPIAELFRRIVPFPESGVNAMRSEVLVSAFASSALTVTPDDQFAICGGSPPSEVLSLLREPMVRRAIAFTLDSPSVPVTGAG